MNQFVQDKLQKLHMHPKQHFILRRQLRVFICIQTIANSHVSKLLTLEIVRKSHEVWSLFLEYFTTTTLFFFASLPNSIFVVPELNASLKYFEDRTPVQLQIVRRFFGDLRAMATVGTIIRAHHFVMKNQKQTLLVNLSSAYFLKEYQMSRHYN